MKLSILTFITSLAIAAVAAWYSIIGLTTIFSAAVVPIIIMGVVLEIGKLVAAAWVYQNWKETNVLLKSYLVSAIVVLMLITSMGIYGFLSKSHIDAGINIEGTNAEVAAGQWEFQIFAKGAAKAGDEIWVARYFLERLAEEYGLAIEYHPKPLGATDWNGSGMHANFSNSTLRTCGSKETYEKICEAFRPVVDEHIAVYGAFNDQRLTGDHETQSITEFSYGVSDRGASIRIPIITVEKGYKGWLEDRRPASNGDPYKIAARIIKTVKSAKV